MRIEVFVFPVAQPFRATRAAECRPEGLRYDRPRRLIGTGDR